MHNGSKGHRTMRTDFFLGVINHMHTTLIIYLLLFFKLLSANFGPIVCADITDMNAFLQWLLPFAIICASYKELHLST